MAQRDELMVSTSGITADIFPMTDVVGRFSGGQYGIQLAALPPSPDEHGVRFATEDEIAAVRGRHAYEYVTPDALRAGDLVVGKQLFGGHVHGYYVIATGERDGR